ncbi:MAG: FAD:protein FMN transferase [Acholeplasmataceae bacterium]
MTDVMGSSVNVVAHTDDSHHHEIYKIELKDIFYLYNYLSYTEKDELNREQLEAYEYGKSLVSVKYNIDDLNKNPGVEFEISRELFDMLTQAEEIRVSSRGYFDYSIGHIIDLWKEGINKYNKEEMPIDEFNILIDKVNKIEIIDEPLILKNIDNHYYATLKEGAKIDLGAFTKGYATQKVIDYLKSKGVIYYLINAGTSSIAVGKNPDFPTYEIGLREPILKRETYGSVKLVDSIITTSGDYEQYFTVNNVRFHHIISPKTKTPSSNYHVLSIIGEDAGLMDAASTALFSMSPEDAEVYVEEINAEAIFYHSNLKVTKEINNVEFSQEITKPKQGIGRYLILGVTIIVSASIIYFAVKFFINTKDKVVENSKLKLIRDLILFGVLAIVFGGIFLNYHFWPRESALKAEITYQQEAYVEIDFQAKDITILKEQVAGYPKKIVGDEYLEVTLLGDYQVDGVKQEVVIFIDFDLNRIKVSEEKSPYNLCSRQGWASHGYIICLPNSVSINFYTGSLFDGVV